MTSTLPGVVSTTMLNNAVTSAGDGLELTLDAATLEQLRASGDGSLVDHTGFGDVAGDDQPPMQVDGLYDEEGIDSSEWNSSMVQLDGPADETDEVGGSDGLEEQEQELAAEEENVDGEEQQILQQLETGEVESSEQHGFEEMLETADGAGGIGEEEAYESAADALASATSEGFVEHLEGVEGEALSIEGAHPDDLNDPAAAYILQVSCMC